ncbi:Mg-dependent DNase [Coemansia reversa NRRL 1564]|uniref:Mg-dependent DNase n=1 Tax=Coemansia reversa (strain ATCC 12441 / NRRL 1564) TaxID=763665 RepID=A0A2G5B7C8_COERN|nr:Mg-dependent DNase [Coemansia reversa NRRL 1564]|eukprot:PIA14882.1 Mg-dependent DNase [Coemansia reversa NRRL 1564]
MRIIDIGANLTDPVFRGIYRGKRAHEDDLPRILERSRSAGVVGIMVTGGSLAESAEAVQLSREHSGLFATAGCHPTRSNEVDHHPGGADAYFAELHQLINDNRDKIVAVGECGLDYDRLQFSDKAAQNKYFLRQFELAEATGLPMFFHNRNTGGDFVRVIRENRHRFGEGVVHSFTGSNEEVRELLALGLHIGINGCSLKTEENLAVVKAIPVDRLILETDCPYCEIRPTHASHKLLQSQPWMTPESRKKERWDSKSMVKSRNEPCMIRSVLAVVANLHGIAEETLAARIFETTCSVFFRDVQHDF